MFKWINKQGVESDAGIVFQRVDRFHYEYRDGDINLRIVVEADAKKENVYVSDVIAQMADADRKLVSENVIAALKFMGDKFQIH